MNRTRSLMGAALLRYALVQLPVFALVVFLLLGLDAWTDVPALALWIIGIVWLAKDVILFPFLWRSYADGGDGYSYSPVGRSGSALDRLDPGGRIRLGTEIWRAQLEEGAGPVEPGATVRITGMQGLILVVRPVDEP